MEPTTLLLLCAAAMVVAAAVVASGFGLGTALTPLFLLTYDIKTAVFLVAIVHFANNLFRLGLFWKQVDSTVVRRFGLLSVVGAVVGSLIQERAAGPWLEIGLGALLIVLGGMELLPRERAWRIPKRFDQAGGLLSGLLGGLLGNQGALRSGYLLNYSLSKESFIASGTAIACLIDTSRIPVYAAQYGKGLLPVWPYLAAVMVASFVGTLAGKRLIEKLPQNWFHLLVAALIALTGAALILTNL